MSAILSLPSLITVLNLVICTCAYLREMRPTIFDGGVEHDIGQTLIKRTGAAGFCWKLSRIGERLSPFVSISCIATAIHVLFIKK
mmetsp:Transcript_30811/g.36622  ORF Transcript_30811/g.36622 Transcript_30811/m.36622 type:complete len:85 (-) Transcript_30811:446-700(-)